MTVLFPEPLGPFERDLVRCSISSSLDKVGLVNTYNKSGDFACRDIQTKVF